MKASQLRRLTAAARAARRAGRIVERALDKPRKAAHPPNALGESVLITGRRERPETCTVAALPPQRRP